MKKKASISRQLKDLPVNGVLRFQNNKYSVLNATTQRLMTDDGKKRFAQKKNDDGKTFTITRTV